ncbi:phosphatase PAP2 family protein [Angustibacter sp. McL0619]|uniref:phosphatase PAP2 family protein n=1 Tax=Angustibacter sp. McL0619 TaxID=3415676 RepID=UPI003CF3834D
MTSATPQETGSVAEFPPRAAVRDWTFRLSREASILLVCWVIYMGGRFVAGGRDELAYQNARRVWFWERTFGLPDEATLQSAAMKVPHLVEVANTYYATVHFPLTIATLVWLFVRHPRQYSQTRRSLLWLTGAALAVHLAFPLAPPRLAVWDGMTDTAVRYGMSVYGPVGTGIANQFAAMPSLHFGWSVLVAVAVVSSLRSRLRWLILVHPGATLIVVVVTANHYLLDCMVAGAIAVLAVRLAAVDILGALRRVVPAAVRDDRASPDGGPRRHPFGR